MSQFAIVALAVALVASVVALAREIQLRKALQRLLSIVLSKWRAHVQKPQDLNAADHRIHDDDRLP